MKLTSISTLAFKRVISIVAGFSISLGIVALPAIPAAATTQLVIPVQDQVNAPLSGVTVVACEWVQGNQICTEAVSNINGDASLALNLNSPNTQVSISAGGSTTSYSLSPGYVSYSSGVLSSSVPTLVMIPTTWVDVIVTVLDTSRSNAVVSGEEVIVSTPVLNSTPIAENKTTTSNGIASFRLDSRFWGGVITATTGGSNSGFQPQTGTVVSGVVSLAVTPLDYTLSGSVTYDSLPVSNKAMTASYNRGNSYTCQNFQTDSNGNYSVTSLGSRMPSIGFGTCNNYVQEFDYVSGFSYDQTNTNQTFNIVLTKTGVDLTVLEAGTNNPIANQSVVLVSASNPGYTPTAVTDQAGIAHFVGLNAGDVYRAAYTRYQGDTSLQLYEVRQNTATVTVGVTDSRVVETLVLARMSSAPATPVSVSGRIVTGLNNLAVPGATVRAYWNSQSGANSQYLQQTVLTDSQGNYSITNFPYGNISISVSAEGYRQTSTYFASSAEGGSTYNRGVINLRPTPLGNLAYSGVLKDSSQNPISGMRLNLYASGGSGQPSAATTDSSGAFSFTNLIQAMYYLSADVWASDSIYQPFTGHTSSVDLTSSQSNVQLSLASRTAGNASLTGRVAEYLDVNSESSATPLSGLTVYAWPKNGGQGYSGVTDSSGEWSISGLNNGLEYHVSVQYNYQSYESPQQNNLVVARSSGGVQHQLLLKRVSAGTGSLTGRVKDASDYSNLAGIQVQLYRSFGGTTVNPVTTDTRGEYSFTNLPSGEYFMVIGGQDQNYKVSYMSVEIGSGSNRINALLTEKLTFTGTISGTVVDDRGIPLPAANVEVWNTNDSSLGGWAQSDNQGKYTVYGLPTGMPLNFRVTPSWDLRYEVSSYLTTTTISNTLQLSAPVMSTPPSDGSGSTGNQRIDVQLEPAAFITGTVEGIPAYGNVPPVSVELIDSMSGTIMSVTNIRSDNGVYTFASVPAGDYLIRYTQRANYQGYSGGGWGFASGGNESEPISLKPVYWDGTTNGTSDRTQAGVVTVVAGGRVAGKSVTVSPGSSIAGTVYVETPDGISRLTGTRSVLVYIYEKQADGTWEQVGYPEAANGYTNSAIKIAGLDAGRYKLKFEDSRRGNNSLSTVYNGGASTLALAPEIVVSSSGVTTVSQTLSVAPPERSAEAIDLDDLGQQLPELENQITVEDELALGSESAIYVGVEFAGEYVSAFANSTPTTLGDWKQVDSNGYISVVVPADLESGSHRVAVQDANLKVIGWTAVTIAKSESEAGVLTYSPRKTTSATVDTSSTSETTKTAPKKSSTPDVETYTEAQSGSIAETNNIWMIYMLSAALLLGIAGAIWLIRSRRS